LWKWIVALALLAALGVLGAETLGSGGNWFRKLTSAWVLIVGIVGFATFLLGLAVGKRPLV
jgi:hypothetical protein